MIRTWLRTKTGAFTLTKAATSIDFWTWATAIAALSSQPSKNSIRIRTPRPDVFEFGKRRQFYPRGSLTRTARSSRKGARADGLSRHGHPGIAPSGHLGEL